MKRLAGLSVLALALSTTAGCSWVSFDWLWGENGMFRDRANDYQEARQVSAMRVPSGTEVRPLEPLMPIPRNVADSRFVGGYDVPRPQRLQTVAAASDVREFSLQVTPDQRWLIALRAPAQLWSSTRQFLLDKGFKIAEEKPHMGEMITAWQKSTEYAPALGGTVVAAGETRLRVRIEPGVQRNTSEIFVLTLQRPVGSKVEPEWPARSEVPALEAAVLDEIQTNFTRSSGSGDTVSLLAERDYDAPSRVTLIKDAAGNPLLQLDSDFDRAWSRVGGAIESADIRVDDLNRTLGIYYINLSEGSSGRSQDKKGFLSSLIFGSGPDPEEVEARAERYQVRVARVSDGIQISVEKDMNTLAPADVARRVLTLLQEHLEHSSKQKKPGAKPSGDPESRGDRPPSR